MPSPMRIESIEAERSGAVEPAGVCLLTETFRPVTGGGETQAWALASGLARAGIPVSVLTRRTSAALARREPMGGVEVWRLPPSGAGQLKKWGLLVTALVALLRARSAYDVVLVCGYRILGIPAVVAALLLRKPCVLKADSLGELDGAFFGPGLRRFGLSGDGLLFRAALRLRNKLFRRASAFVAISSAVERELLRCGVDATRIHRIPNSVDTDLFSPAGTAAKHALRQRLGIPRDARVAIFTGRLETTKGLPMLLEAWRQAAAGHPEARLLLVGAGGLGINNCEAKLRAYVERHRLGGSVTFVGSVENVHDYLRAADFFVFPTQREAFGISVIEALACGVPVITTAAGGLEDIVTAEHTAIVVPAGDVDAWAAAIRRLLQGEAGGIAAAGRRLAETRYAQARVLEAYRALLRDLHAPSRRREGST